MFSWLKSHLGAILSGVAGAVATAIIGFFAASEGPAPAAEVSWITIPVARFFNDDELRKQSAALEKVFQTPELPGILADFQYRSDATIFVVKVTNKTDRRSKPVEVSCDETSMFVVHQPASTGRKFIFSRGSGPATISPLAPGESAQVVVLSKSYSWYSKFPLRVLHDGRSVRPQLQTIGAHDDVFGTFSLLIRWSPFSDIALVALLAIAAFFLVVAIWYGTMQRDFPSLAKFTQKDEAERIVRFADYLRASRPDKLPIDLRAAPSPPTPPTPPSSST